MTSDVAPLQPGQDETMISLLKAQCETEIRFQLDLNVKKCQPTPLKPVSEYDFSVRVKLLVEGPD